MQAARWTAEKLEAYFSGMPGIGGEMPRERVEARAWVTCMEGLSQELEPAGRSRASGILVQMAIILHCSGYCSGTKGDVMSGSTMRNSVFMMTRGDKAGNDAKPESERESREIG